MITDLLSGPAYVTYLENLFPGYAVDARPTYEDKTNFTFI